MNRPCLLRTAPLGVAGTIGPRLQTRNQKKIDNFDRSIHAAHANRSSCRRLRQKLRVFHGKNATVHQMDVKRLEWPLAVHLSQLLDGHIRDFTLHSEPGNQSLGLRRTSAPYTHFEP